MKLGIVTSLAVAGAAAAMALAPSGAATTPKIVAFTGTYSGTAVVQVTDSVAAITANGKGTGTLLGAGSIAGNGKGDSSQQPCVPFSGPGTITGIKGTKLVFTVANGAQGCGDEQGQVFSISGKAIVSKGAGTLLKAHGTLKFTGVYDKGAGTFSVKFKGSLTV